MKFIYKDELCHHGIKGQRWGVMNGPPYPLNESDKSSSEKKEETSNNRSRKPSKDGKDIAKKVLLVAGGVAVVGVGSYVAYKYVKSRNGNIGDLATNLSEAIKRGDISANPDVLINKSVVDSFTKSEKNAMQYYTTADAYKIVNFTLRGKDPSWINENYNIGMVGQQIMEHGYHQDLIRDMTSAINKSTLDRDVTSTRMTDLSGLCGLLHINEKDIFSKSKDELLSCIGKNVVEEGFYSSSPGSPKSYFGHIKFTTLCPKGTKGFYYGGLSELSNEQELLLQRGTTFKIMDIKFPSSNGSFADILKAQDGIEVVLQVIDQIKGD